MSKTFSFNTEPVITLVTGFIVALAAVLVAFGVDLTDTQVAALVALAVASIPVVVYVRSKVTPTVKLEYHGEPVESLEDENSPQPETVTFTSVAATPLNNQSSNGASPENDTQY